MSAFLCKFARKPSSVHYGHQSRRTVADTFKPPPENGRVSLLFSHGVAPDRVYSINMSPCDEWALTSLFHPYRVKRRYISVALVRGSPLAGVTRYPCPMEPGLSSRTGFRLVPAVVRPTHDLYSIHFPALSKHNLFIVMKREKTYNVMTRLRMRGDLFDTVWVCWQN